MENMEKLVLITGAKGFIGTHLRALYPNADTFDLSDGQDICGELPDKPYTHIFHLAAKHHIPTCEIKAEECIRTNCWGTINVLKTYPNARIIVSASSSSNEIKSVYGASKAFLDLLTKMHKNYLAVKFYNVFGEYQRLEGGAVTPKLIDHMLRKKPLTINGDGTQFRDFTYVGDVVNNLKELMESDQVGVTHLGHGEPIMLNHYIDLIYGETPTDVTYTEHNPIDILWSKAPFPCKKFFGREEGMRRTIEWFKKEYSI